MVESLEDRVSIYLLPNHLFIVYFLLCHESLNYSMGGGGSINMTIDWHYTMALVTRFPVKNTQARIDMRSNDACTVRL